MNQIDWLTRFAARRGVLGPAEFWSLLASAYTSPDRAYHTLDHLRELCQWFARVEDGPGWTRPQQVLLAVLFHDAVYVPSRHDNEKRSAELAHNEITRIGPRLLAGAVQRGAQPALDRDQILSWARRVVYLIELTGRHGSQATTVLDVDAAHFVDADMAILAAPRDRFREYDEQIAREYAPYIPVTLFQLGRKRFFQHLLHSEHIYQSEFFRARCEARARINLRRAVAE